MERAGFLQHLCISITPALVCPGLVSCSSLDSLRCSHGAYAVRLPFVPVRSGPVPPWFSCLAILALVCVPQSSLYFPRPQSSLYFLRPRHYTLSLPVPVLACHRPILRHRQALVSISVVLEICYPLLLSVCASVFSCLLSSFPHLIFSKKCTYRKPV